MTSPIHFLISFWIERQPLTKEDMVDNEAQIHILKNIEYIDALEPTICGRQLQKHQSHTFQPESHTVKSMTVFLVSNELAENVLLFLWLLQYIRII